MHQFRLNLSLVIYNWTVEQAIGQSVLIKLFHLMINLYIPGTVWTDFVPQLEGLDKTKYTLIFIDLPGCGKSRPPNRDFSQGKLLFYRDASVAAKLMEVKY